MPLSLVTRPFSPRIRIFSVTGSGQGSFLLSSSPLFPSSTSSKRPKKCADYAIYRLGTVQPSQDRSSSLFGRRSPSPASNRPISQLVCSRCMCPPPTFTNPSHAPSSVTQRDSTLTDTNWLLSVHPSLAPNTDPRRRPNPDRRWLSYSPCHRYPLLPLLDGSISLAPT
jgi:hypothetical protein